jgi:hypothetical protein
MGQSTPTRSITPSDNIAGRRGGCKWRKRDFLNLAEHLPPAGAAQLEGSDGRLEGRHQSIPRGQNPPEHRVRRVIVRILTAATTHHARHHAGHDEAPRTGASRLVSRRPRILNAGAEARGMTEMFISRAPAYSLSRPAFSPLRARTKIRVSRVVKPERPRRTRDCASSGCPGSGLTGSIAK